MKFPPEQVSPHRALSSVTKQEAEVYAHKSAIRGLFDKKYISETPTLYSKDRIPDYPRSWFNSLLDPRSADFLPLNVRAEYNDLLKKKKLGLHCEIAFHIYRGLDYHVAFKVAESYVYHGVVDYETGEVLYPHVYPDACLDTSCSVLNLCLGSKTIDVKGQSYEGNNKYVGLGITNDWWLNHSHDDFYVAASECPSHNASLGGTYEVIDYAILGYAFKEEVDAVTPNTSRWRYRNIHCYNLHPIDCLTPYDYETSETVCDRMQKLGYPT